MADIVLPFRDKEYRIPDNKAFQIGEMLEEIATLYEVLGWVRDPKFHKLARCYGTMLRFAGCEVSDREVKAEIMMMFGGGGDAALAAIQMLIAVLMDGAPAPTEPAQSVEGGEAEKAEAS